MPIISFVGRVLLVPIVMLGAVTVLLVCEPVLWVMGRGGRS